MSCRFPGAKTPEEFWDNLWKGKESISFFSDSELRDAGVPEALLRAPHYVKAAPVLDDVDRFDADFFKCSPKEAAALDPQHRFFLECAWEALENAGYDPLNVPNRAGVFAGALINTYLLARVAAESTPLSLDFSDFLETLIASDKDFLATRISYKLNLKGPSLTVQTACSTSLVAVHLACQSLLNGECETALAGAVSIRFPHRVGYTYRPGGLVSPDGHCRPFSDRSQGTLFGSGIGIVVLKRLEDAISDGDFIHAVIRGTAINNDGASKMSYTAPAVDGHSEVVAEALAVAGVDAGSIGYVETHGTATELGDPVEFTALTQAFRLATDRKQFCALGSVKSNIGHLDAAAGMAGLIKAISVVKKGAIPPTLHFDRPSPKIHPESSPFFINTVSMPWHAAPGPRRAGVSSLGVGGTNAHAILEEFPGPASNDTDAGSPRLLVLSARSASALQAQVTRYRDHLLRNPNACLADVCYTAARGRRPFDRRVAIVARNVAEAAERLAKVSVVDGKTSEPPRIAFLFSGQGSQYAGMARSLYEAYPPFRASLESSQEFARPFMDRPLLSVIFAEDHADLLNRTLYAQPAILAVDLAVFDLWQSWGVAPAMAMGHSLGEYAAATVAGVFRRADVFRLVCERARLMQDLPAESAMAAIRGAADSTLALVRETPDLEIAALNSPEEVVLSGPRHVVVEAGRRLEGEGSTCRLLAVSHAFHSKQVEPILDRLEYLISTMALSAPGLPIVSNVTGQLAGREMATPAYWRRHARETVRFAEGIQTLHREGCRAFLEAGPGSSLLGLGASCLPDDSAWLASLRRTAPDETTILESLGRLYTSGVSVDWNGFYQGQSRRRVPLPTYPFEGKRYWIETAAAAAKALPDANRPDWLYDTQWRVKTQRADRGADRVLIIGDGGGLAARLHENLRARGIVTASDVTNAPRLKTAVVDLSALDIAGADFEEAERVTAHATDLASNLAKQSGAFRLWIVTRGTQPTRRAVTKAGVFQAALCGIARGIEIEHSDLWGGLVDLDPEGSADEVEMLAREILSAGDGENRIAYRGAERLVSRLTKVKALPIAGPMAVSADATYLITGGTGGIGPALARWLVDRGARHLVVTSRSGSLPESLKPLRALGADLRIERVDASNASAMSALIRSVESAGHPLRGIFHLAGVMQYESLENTSASVLAELMRPKTRGAWVLHEITQGMKLDFFVLFSSISSMLGGREMGAYAAANAFLDSLADYRRSAGLPALTVNWGPWAGSGMGEARVAERVRSGVALMDPTRALECLAALMNSGQTQALAADLDWSVFRPLYESRGACSFLEDVAPATAKAPTAAPAGSPEIVRLRSAPPLQQPALLKRYVQTQVFAVLGIDPAEGMDMGTRLFEAGLDSLRGIELRNKLQSDLECRLPATLTLNHPTVEAIAGYLATTVPFLQKPGNRRIEKVLKP
jgi:acyl transferase domain-containing protein/acyl carrier protein